MIDPYQNICVHPLSPKRCIGEIRSRIFPAAVHQVVLREYVLLTVDLISKKHKWRMINYLHRVLTFKKKTNCRMEIRWPNENINLFRNDFVKTNYVQNHRNDFSLDMDGSVGRFLFSCFELGFLCSLPRWRHGCHSIDHFSTVRFYSYYSDESLMDGHLSHALRKNIQNH